MNNNTALPSPESAAFSSDDGREPIGHIRRCFRYLAGISGGCDWNKKSLVGARLPMKIA